MAKSISEVATRTPKRDLLKILSLDQENFLVDEDGIRHKRNKPIAIVGIEASDKNPDYAGLEEAIFNLRDGKKIKHEIDEPIQGFLITHRIPIDTCKVVYYKRIGKQTYYFNELRIIELYALGEYV